MNNGKINRRTKIIAVILVLFMLSSLIAPICLKCFAEGSSNGTESISSSSNIVVNYYNGVPDELTKDSESFDLTVGMMDPNVSSTDGLDEGTGYVVLESASFYGVNTNKGTLRQSGSTSSDGPMKLIATFKDVKYNGVSNVMTLRVGYNIDGVVKSEKVSFLVSQIPIDEKETKKDPAPPPSPKIVIDESNYGGKEVNTKEAFNLSFSYFNSSSVVKMENLKIEVSGGENFVINNNTNTFYVEELAPKGVKSQSVNFTALDSIKESSSYPITLKFTYEYVVNKERKNGEDISSIYIPVHKVKPPQRLTISAVDCSPTEVEPEEDSTVTIQVANKGKSDVYNVSLAIEGNFKSETYVKDLGTIPTGKVVSPTFKITTLPQTVINESANNSSISAEEVKNKDSNQTEMNEGVVETQQAVIDNKLNGKVIITFEDEDGNPYTIDRMFTVNVNIPSSDDGEMLDVESQVAEMPQEEVDSKGKKMSKPLLIGIISGGVIVLGGTSYFVYRKIKSKRSELLDEDI